MTAVGHANDAATISDRRELPFFTVYTRVVAAIREHTAGPRRVRTIGFYGLLCQLANEQRSIGQQRRVRYSYDLLAARGGVSKGSIAHLLVHEHSFIAVTVPMADRLAAPRNGGHLLRDLGLIVVLLEFCVRQGSNGTWTQAQVTRSQIAEHSVAACRTRRRLPPHARSGRSAHHRTATSEQRRTEPAEHLHRPRSATQPGR